jgi:hypothetical protein
MPRVLRHSWLALVALSSLLAACKTTQDVETVFLPERGTWVQVHAADDGHQTITEAVPEGQTLENWREMITIQAFDDRGPASTPRATMESLDAQMRTRGGQVEWNVIEEEASSILYEWTLHGAPGHEDQGEIARLMQGHDTLHRAAYAYKGLPLSAERRESRIALLRRGRIVKGEKEYWAAVDELMPEESGKH